MNLPPAFGAPIQLAAGLFLMHSYVGTSAFVGIGCAALTAILMVCPLLRLAMHVGAFFKSGDSRLNAAKELVMAIKIVKVYVSLFSSLLSLFSLSLSPLFSLLSSPQTLRFALN